MTDRVPYDEFALFGENAEEFGLPFDSPPVVRRESVEVAPGRTISALIWGSAAPELVLIHGGAQNAHTWDTVALALNRPLVAIDLPGHGHSDAPADVARVSPVDNANDVAVAIRQLAPDASAIVGMSLGGLTTIALSSVAPELVRKIVLVDITPGVTSAKAAAIHNFVQGPATFPSFEELLARTIEHNPTRTVASLRRGILHNAMQLEDGTWQWRYRRFGGSPLSSPNDPSSGDSAGTSGASGAAGAGVGFSPLWDSLQASPAPVLLVRGMLKQSVVDDADVSELQRRRPDAVVAEVANAGHSVQGDAPLELANLIANFVS